jgi:nicotinamide riboside transporter PnuC
MVRWLKTLSWIASVISIIGTLLNAYQLIICWPVWCFGNLIWIYYSWKTKQTAQVILWIVFTISNIYAWYMWSIL